MIQQLEVIQQLSHPHIMNTLEVLHDQDNFYIACEICKGGELYKRVKKSKILDESKTALIIKQVLLGLNYMHLNNILHRDMKLSNIIMKHNNSNNLEIKVTDFGFARYFDNDEGLNFSLGSPFYVAPEMYSGQKYDEKIDIWSVGVITYVILTGT